MYYYYLFIIYMMIIMLFLFILSLYFLIQKFFIFMEFEVLNIFSMKFEMIMLFDWMSLMFISVVILISSMVILFSIEYMVNEIDINRFMILVILFIISMILMIISPNMISILLGWDGLGLVSYCLVIYYQNESSFNSGMVVVLTNRIGDIMILMLISLMLIIGSWNFMFFNNMSNLMLMFLIIAAFTKSAQIPFSSWLPLAMAAPTPVSSLVHSSTLVTAGVYLMIRFNYLMLGTKLMEVIVLISIFTMFMSGLGANFENDLKKIIALSTLSQLGVMIFSLFIGFKMISFFHLLTHAMFKSMLFMCSGIIIHNMLGNQDIRFLSMIFYNMPFVSIIFCCATFSLCGIPFLSGFFSKDLILEMYMMNFFNKMIFLILFISMGLTIMYSFRLMYYSFIKIMNINVYLKYNSLMSLMSISMYILFFFSIILGSLLSWLLFSMKNYIYLNFNMKMIIYMFMLIGMLLGWGISMIFMKFNYNNFNMFFFFMKLWLIFIIYNNLIMNILWFSGKLIYFIECGWSEYFMGRNMINYMIKIFYTDFFNSNYFNMLIIIMYFILLIMI